MKKMKNGSFFLISSTAIMMTICAIYGQTAPSEPQPQTYAGALTPGAAAIDPGALLDQYCVGCHNDQTPTASLTLESADLSSLGENRDVWEKVVRRLRAGMMPPAGAPRPEASAHTGLVEWMEAELDRDPAPYMPPSGIHRLNRSEYANVIRDLLALEVDVPTLLPADDSSYGFDNMAGTLGLSSTLVEAYVSAAGKISRLAIGGATTPVQITYRVRADSSQRYHIEGLPFGTRGGMLVRHEFPTDGEYTITVNPMTGDNMSPQPFGSIPNEKLEVLLDGQLLELLDWNPGQRRGGSDEAMAVGFQTTAGTHTIGVTFLQTNLAPALDIDQHFMRDTIQTGPFPGFTFFPHVGGVRIDGPRNAEAANDSPSRRKIFVCRPGAEAEEEPCARQILTELATRAFRHPASLEEVEPLMRFYQSGRSEGEFDSGIQLALQRILADPKFLYRMEEEPPDLGAGEIYPISDLEQASRLSFFLWSSMPDDRLLNLAAEGRLGDPAVLGAEVRRMLADPRAGALADNFAGKWLNLRGLESTNPLPMIYSNFDDPLRQSMRREVELLFETIVGEDRSVIDLLDADYTFVDERLARHYGMSGVYGSRFRRVPIGGAFEVRRGLLGKGAVLATTSKPERNSPVTRGKWIMTNMLGVSPPDLPPDVPQLEPKAVDVTGNVREPSMRQKMAAHQVRPDCVQCHRLMDPIGFALENFDATGAWRMEDGGEPIVVDDTLYDGTRIEGPAGLRDWMLGYSDQFVRVATEKLLTYALGRGVEPYDMPVVRSIVNSAAARGYRFSDLVLGVINSPPFRMNMKLGSGVN